MLSCALGSVVATYLLFSLVIKSVSRATYSAFSGCKSPVSSDYSAEIAEITGARVIFREQHRANQGRTTGARTAQGQVVRITTKFSEHHRRTKSQSLVVEVSQFNFYLIFFPFVLHSRRSFDGTLIPSLSINVPRFIVENSYA